MDYVKMLTKGILGVITGTVAVAVLGAAQAISGYQPVICSETITTGCTSQIVANIWLGVIPLVVGGLTSFANWIKHKNTRNALKKVM